jgi:outer membrane immunogenic protein
MCSILKSKTLIALSLAIALSSTAQAQETSPVSWDGLYAGAAVGVSFSKTSPNTSATGTGYFTGNDISLINPRASENIEALDLNGNVFAGINKSTGNMVYGMKFDLSFMNYNSSSASSRFYDTAPAFTFAVSTKVKSNWAVSLQPQLGYAQGDTLYFASAGPSLSQFEYKFTFTDDFAPQNATVSKSVIKLGFTAGFGLQKKLNNDLSLRVGYSFTRYTDVINATSALRTVPGQGFSHNFKHELHNATVGLVKHF